MKRIVGQIALLPLALPLAACNQRPTSVDAPKQAPATTGGPFVRVRG